MYKEKVDVVSSVEIINDVPLEIIGDEKATKLILKNGEIITDGIFILRDSISPGQLVPGLIMDKNHIQVVEPSHHFRSGRFLFIKKFAITLNLTE